MRARDRMRRMVLKSGWPEDALTGCARVTMMGRSAVMVEGQRGVVEMSDACIRLRTEDGVLGVTGDGLRLAELSADAAMITGERIESVGYGRR